MIYIKNLADKLKKLATHPRASWLLGLVSFADSSLFPITPMVLFIPLCLLNRSKIYKLALLTTITSVLGGGLGYLLGLYSYDYVIAPFLERMHYMQQFTDTVAIFDKWGGWIVFIACFLPMPYKIFTIASGFVHLNIVEFFLASCVGRAMRFYGAAVTIAYWPRFRPLLAKLRV